MVNRHRHFFHRKPSMRMCSTSLNGNTQLLGMHFRVCGSRPCLIWGRSTESIEGFPSMEEEKWEELVEAPPAVLLLWPFVRLPLLESRKALSSENCRGSGTRTIAQYTIVSHEGQQILAQCKKAGVQGTIGH